MLRFAIGAFIALHGLVHLLYVGQSSRLFELQPGLSWPSGSWAFSRLLSEKTTTSLASITYTAAALAFIVGGAGLLARQSWWRGPTVAAAVLSATMVMLFWDGRVERVSDQGLFALLINAAILAALFIFRWPNLEL
jgi:hypothetical protein